MSKIKGLIRSITNNSDNYDKNLIQFRFQLNSEKR